MNKEIIEQILPIVEKTKEGALKIIEALQREAPEVVRELLWWNGVTSFLAWAFAIGLIVVYLWYAKRLWRWADDSNNMDSVPCTAIASGIYFLIAGFILLFNFDWLQIIVAPRLYLLEYVTELLTKS